METTTGVKLEQTFMTECMKLQANQYGLTSLRVFLATHPDGKKEYLLADGAEPIFASQLAEAVAAHIDMMALARNI